MSLQGDGWAEEARRRKAMLKAAPEVLEKASAKSAEVKPLAGFEPFVLEHLRQRNLDAYERVVSDINEAILKVLQRA